MRLNPSLVLVTATACVGVQSNPNPAHDAAGDAAADAAIVHAAKKMFVTSEVYQGGSLAGLAGADANCLTRAESAGLLGMYKAWLSTSAESPGTRFTHSTAEYKLVDGTRVASSWEDLARTNLMHAVNLTETGQPYIPPQTASDCMTKIVAWTATEVDGTPYVSPVGGDYTCGGWTLVTGSGATGEIKEADGSWTKSGCALSCSAKAALYCVEQ